MYLISPEGYKNADVPFSRLKKAGKVWASMKNVQDGLVVKNMSDLILKEVYGIYETRNLTKEQIKKYKLTEIKFFRKI